MKSCSFLFFLVTVLFVLVFLAGSAFAATINVPADYPTLNAAVVASSAGDTIIIAAGTYSDSNIYIDGPLSPLTITGADQDTTIVNAGGNNRVMEITGATVNISGLTLTNGAIDGETGSGIYITDGATVTISDCTISNNTTTNQSAGGIDITDGATCTLDSCTVANNSAESSAGISVDAGGTLTIIDSTISNNTATQNEGGGIRIDGGGVTATITNSTISSNTSESNGGGISISDGATATITGCTVASNTTGGPGGGGITTGAGCETTITGCTISSNSATGGGGGGLRIVNPTASPVTVTNCLITNNEIAGTGSGLWIQCDDLTLTNCTIANNTEQSGGTIFVASGSSATFTNCIIADAPTYGIVDANETPITAMQYNLFYNNTTAPYATTADQGSTFTTYSIAEINAITIPASTGNIGTNPRFLPAESNYHLLSPSPCINGGTSSGAPTTDRDGNTRPQGPSYDIGCYEYLSSTWYFAEGCTREGFDTWILVQNPTASTAEVTATFYNESGTTTTLTGINIMPTSRYSINLNSSLSSVDGFNNNDVSAKIEAINDVSIKANRSMYLTNGACHTSQGTSNTATTWYFAEGATAAPFDEWLLMLNPNDTAVTVSMEFYTEDGTTVTPDDISVPATSRYTVQVDNLTDLGNLNGIGAKITTTNTGGIVVERSMYMDDRGTCSIGTPALNTTWYLPEGATNGFRQYVLITNPNSSATTATCTFYKEDGTTVESTASIGAYSRYTTAINDISGLADLNGVGAKITATASIVVEQALYNDTIATCGIASPSTGTTWYLAEGCTNGFDTYVPILNPNSTSTTATYTLMNEDGTTVQATQTIPANSRATLKVNDVSDMDDVTGFSTQVSSADNVGIVVGRAMYQDSGDGHYSIGGN